MRIVQFQVADRGMVILMEDGRMFYYNEEKKWVSIDLPEHPMGLPKNPLGPPPEDVR